MDTRLMSNIRLLHGWEYSPLCLKNLAASFVSRCGGCYTYPQYSAKLKIKSVPYPFGIHRRISMTLSLVLFRGVGEVSRAGLSHLR